MTRAHHVTAVDGGGHPITLRDQEVGIVGRESTGDPGRVLPRTASVRRN